MDYEGDVASLTMWFFKILLSGTSSDCICIMGRLSVLWDSTFISIRVIPNQFNQSFHMIVSESDEAGFVWSTCGHMNSATIWASYTVWLPG